MAIRKACIDRVALGQADTIPNVQLIAGNIVTGDAALRAASMPAPMRVKVGVGPGSICTTRVVAGVGVPQITAIDRSPSALQGSTIPLIADGGIRYSGDIAKAMAAGASSVMLGAMFAGTEESPGEVELFQGRSYKTYRGMGSLGAMSAGLHRPLLPGRASTPTSWCPKASRAACRTKGRCRNIVHQLIGGLRASMGYIGCADDRRHAQQAAVRAGHRGRHRRERTCTTCRSPRKRRTTALN